MAVDTIYVDPILGDDSGSGGFSLPFKTIGQVKTWLSAFGGISATVNLMGKFQIGENLEDTGLTFSLTVQQWLGKTQAQVRGDVPTTGWTVVSGSVFFAAGPTVTPVSVVWNWDSNTHSDGRHFGHLVPGTFDSLNEGEWAYEASSDEIQVWLPSEAGVSDPDDLTEIAYTIAGSGIFLAGTGTIIVDGIQSHLWVGAGDYCIVLSGGGGTGYKIKNCTCYDGGFHIIGCNSTTKDCDVTNCTVGGCRETGGSSYVMFGSDSGLVFTGSCVDCTVIMGGLLTDTDTTIMTGGTSGPGAQGFLTHTDGSTIITDLVIVRLAMTGNPECTGAATGINNLTAVETDAEDGETYPVRFYDCVGTNLCRSLSTNTTGSLKARAALFRCKFEGDLDYAGSGNAEAFLIDDGDSKVYLESCEIVYDTGTAGTRQIIRIFTDAFLTLVNCSFYQTNDASSSTHSMFRYQGATGVKARQCVFQFDSAAVDRFFIGGDGSDDASTHDFIDCWYDNFVLYSSNSSFDTQTEWTSEIDANGVYEVDPLYTSVTDLTPTLASTLRTRKKILAWPSSRIGRLRQPYDGSYGAYQLDVTALTPGSGYVAMGHFGLVEPALL